MNEQKVAIVDAAFIHPDLKEPIKRSGELIEILRQQGKKLVFLGNETGYAGSDYQESMYRLAIHPTVDDKFLSGTTLLAMSAKAMNAGSKVIFENGNEALSKEFSRLGLQADDDLDGDPQVECRVYIGNLIKFAYNDTVRLLQKLDRRSTAMLVAFCSQRIGHQRSATRMLMNSLSGTGSPLDKILSCDMQGLLFDVVSACNFIRDEQKRQYQQHISVVTSDAEIYATAREIRTKFADPTDALFYVESSQTLHNRSMTNLIYFDDKVPNLDAVIDRLQKM